MGTARMPHGIDGLAVHDGRDSSALAAVVGETDVAPFPMTLAGRTAGNGVAQGGIHVTG